MTTVAAACRARHTDPDAAAQPGGRVSRLLPPGTGLAGTGLAGRGPGGLHEHQARYGPLRYAGQRGRLIPLVEAAGLTGRGGAAFPAARKLAAVAAASGKPVVIGNGAEGEPASAKDATLLWQSPHLVLDGLQLAAEAVGSASAGLYVQRDPRLLGRLHAALAERAAAGLDRAAVQIFGAPPRFLAGEETVLAASISGKQALPRFTPPRVFERGVDGRPTLVQNVETLAQLALIARYGPDWFRAVGTPAEPGSMLCTVQHADGSREVTETALGTPLRSLLRAGPGIQAVLAGGYHGGWLPAAQAAQLTLSNADLRPAGAFTGAGVLVAFPAHRCGIAETARVARYLAAESAGQCGPCLNGLPRMATALGELAGRRPSPDLVSDVLRWAGLVDGRGACRHPDGTARFVRSALAVFGAELSAHTQGHCAERHGADPSRQPVLPLPAGWASSGAEEELR